MYGGDPATRSNIIDREVDRGALLTSAVGYSYEFDNRITGLNPDMGVVLRFGQEFGGLGGDNKYISTTVFALAERKVANEEITLRAIFEGGYRHSLGGDPSRATDRFFLRGKMRGFEPNGIGPRDLGATNKDALGGNAFAVARFEAEFPLGLPEEYNIMGGAFLDVGTVWSLDDTAGTGGTVDDGFARAWRWACRSCGTRRSARCASTSRARWSRKTTTRSRPST